MDSYFNNETLVIRDANINTDEVNVISDFVFSAKYKNITENPNEMFKAYAPYVFGVDGQYIKPEVFTNKNYSFYQYDQISTKFDIITATTNNVTYKWVEDEETYYAFVRHENQANHQYLMSKLVLDNYVNRFLDSLTFTYITHSTDNYLLFEMNLVRRVGDGFYIDFQVKYHPIFSNSVLYITIFGYIVILFHFFVRVLIHIQRNHKMYWIYNSWYINEIGSKFNDFMLRERKKYGYEWWRYFKFVSRFNEFAIDLCIVIGNLVTVCCLIRIGNFNNHEANELRENRDILVIPELYIEHRVHFANYHSLIDNMAVVAFGCSCLHFIRIFRSLLFFHSFKSGALGLKYSLIYLSCLTFPLLIVVGLLIQSICHTMFGEI